MIRDRPAHDPAAERVKHHREEHLAFVGGVFGDVHHPQPIWPVGIERPVDEIVGRHRSKVAAGAATPATSIDPADAGLAHEPLDAFARAAPAEPETQFSMHPRTAIGTP